MNNAEWVAALGDPEEVVPKLRRVKHYEQMRIALSWVLTLVMVWVAVEVYLHSNLIYGALVLFVGTPLAGFFLGPLVTLPLGYLLFGRKTMQLRVEMDIQLNRPHK